MNLDELLSEARALGAWVEPVNRTGEIRIRHAALPRPVTVNGRRKDAPRSATVALKRIREAASK